MGLANDKRLGRIPGKKMKQCCLPASLTCTQTFSYFPFRSLFYQPHPLRQRSKNPRGFYFIYHARSTDGGLQRVCQQATLPLGTRLFRFRQDRLWCLVQIRLLKILRNKANHTNRHPHVAPAPAPKPPTPSARQGLLRTLQRGYQRYKMAAETS